ncbi:MAG: C10 family peptidase, partial [Bacteroidales bacterium]|nr:C10 family peptidase [Bacteroidales bacterium]
NSKTPLRSADGLQLVTTYNIDRGDAAFHIFNTSNGFVIVAADDCATPVLGYSDEGRFDVNNIPIQLQDYLQGFVEEIQYGIENHLEADGKTIREWEMVKATGHLMSNRSNRTVDPLLTSEWGQNCYYNAMCPEDEGGYCGHAVTGCVATAMAQIMRYWGYPENGTGSHSYIPESHPEYGTLSVDFGATTYQWSAMPNTLSSSNYEAVATLMYHCGVSVNMDYGPRGSGAWSVNVRGALTSYFGYSNEMSYEGRSSYTIASWKAKLKDCINLGRPVYYSGSTGSVAHVFVCDGYDMYDMFHINWGWDGSSNGYFAIGALNVSGGLNYYEFNTGNNALFNIHPQGDATNYVINVLSSNVEGGLVSGGGTFAHGSTVTLSATPNSGYDFCYWEENGGIASTNPNYSFTANFNRDLTAVFAAPFNVTVSALEGGTASGGGTFRYGESCTVTAIPDEGYAFANWTKNGSVASINSNYTFVVMEESLLVAHFVSLEGNIVFEDANVKAICVANWDTNGDGELSYAEAAVVTSLGEVFRSNKNIATFEELQYFVSLTSLGFCAFSGCSGLTSLTIPNSVTLIGEAAFYGCSGLTSLVIPNSVVSIGPSAFSGCSGLNSLTIPNAVSEIGNYAFSGCSGLTSIIIYAETPPMTGTNVFYNVSTNIPVYVPCESTEMYQEARSWDGFSNIIGMCSGTITVTANPVDGGETMGAGTYEGGTICTVVAMPAEGFYFYYWTENDNIISTEANYSFPVAGDRHIVACFGSPIIITITADPEDGGTVSGGGEFSYGETCTLTATPAEGNCFLSWTHDGEIVSTDAAYSFVVYNDMELMAHFAKGAMIGDGSTTTDSSLPSRATYKYTLSQQIYTAEELGEAGVITRIAFYNGGTVMTRTYDFYLKATEKTEFSSRNDWEVVSEADKVFSGSVTLTTNAWTIIVFDTPFEYDGTSNLVLVTDDNTSKWSIGMSCRVYNAQGNQSLCVYSDGTNYDPLAPSEYNGTLGNVKNQLILTKYTPITDPINITVSASPARGGTVSGGGTYCFGETCTVTATSNLGYVFSGWIENGQVVSRDLEFSFMVLYDRNLVATFEEGVMIGDGGDATNEYLPSYSFYKYSLSQQIYTAEEIGLACTIKSIAFYNDGAAKTRNYDMYLVHTDKTVFSGNRDWIAVTEANKVFSGEMVMVAGDWTVFVLDTPFEYDGTSNLALVMDDNTGSYTGSPQVACRVFNTNGNQAIRVYSDSSNYDPYNPSAYNGTRLSVKNQIILGIASPTVAHTLNLSQGWNWISTYIDLNEVDGITMLEEALGDYGVTIQTYNESADYFGDGEWSGLEDYVWTNAEMVMVEVSEDCTIAIAGPTVVDPSTVEIEIHPGWNWIGFPVATETAIGVAMAGFEAEEEDAIQSNVDGTSDYLDEWVGDVLTLVPGQGYMYYSNSTETKTLVFSTAANGMSVSIRKRK